MSRPPTELERLGMAMVGALLARLLIAAVQAVGSRAVAVVGGAPAGPQRTYHPLDLRWGNPSLRHTCRPCPCGATAPHCADNCPGAGYARRYGAGNPTAN